jgi:hypothetical protein
MANFKELINSDVKTSQSHLYQLVDIPQGVISGTTTRQKYEVWISGSSGTPGVTSSLYQTIYDQDYTYQTANPLFDLTVGLFTGSAPVQGSLLSIDDAGKYLFPSQSVQMREKMDIYRQFAQQLLGDGDSLFETSTSGSTVQIKEALFVNFKRLFHRDQIKRETFAMKFYPTGSSNYNDPSGSMGLTGSTLTADTSIFTDVGSASNKEITFGGQIGTIVDSANTLRPMGVMFYDQGVAVMDLRSIVNFKQAMNGVVDALNGTAGTRTGTGGFSAFSISIPTGQEYFECAAVGGAEVVPTTLYPFSKFLVSGSIDNIVDHIAEARFGGTAQTSETAMVFQNTTNINSTQFFCRASADEFNYSSNPTYVDANNRIVVIDEGQEETEESFTYVTSVGLYDANNNLLAVAKLSRPVLKNNKRDITFSVATDW